MPFHTSSSLSAFLLFLLSIGCPSREFSGVRSTQFSLPSSQPQLLRLGNPHQNALSHIPLPLVSHFSFSHRLAKDWIAENKGILASRGAHFNRRQTKRTGPDPWFTGKSVSRTKVFLVQSLSSPSCSAGQTDWPSRSLLRLTSEPTHPLILTGQANPVLVYIAVTILGRNGNAVLLMYTGMSWKGNALSVNRWCRFGVLHCIC